MSAAAQCEFFLLRYVPDAVKGEFINLGVVLVQSNGSGPLFADVRFTSDWERIRSFDPYADVEMLKSLEADVRRRLRISPQQWTDLRGQIERSFANAVQLAEPQGCLSDSPAQALDEVAHTYLESRPRVPEAARPGARRAVLASIKDAFVQAGVWQLMVHNIAVRDYVSISDPLKIDCGYENGRVRMFHALALEESAASAKSLAFSFPELRAALQSRRNKPAELTAICSAAEAEDADHFSMAGDILRKSEIRLATTADLAMLAAEARKDLRL